MMDCNKRNAKRIVAGVCGLLVLALIVYAAVISSKYWKDGNDSNPVLPSLKQPPSTIESETTYATIQWQDEYNGDGPTCGYVIDKMGLGDDVTPWTTAGLVQLESGRQSEEQRVFNLTDLEPATDYQVSVRPILCDGTRIIHLGEGPLLSLTTSRIEPPTLMTAPILTNLSTSQVVFEWSSEHHGDGPVCGYDINLKKVVDDDNELWLSVGFVPVGSKLEFYIGHLEAHTSYLVAVSVINCLSGENGPRRPVLSFKTLEPFTVTSNTLSPAVLNRTDTTEIPPATESSVCRNVNCTVCLQNTTLGKCSEWKWTSIGLAIVILFLVLGLPVLSCVINKQRRKNNNEPTKRNASQCTVSTIPVQHNDEWKDTGNTYM